MAKFSATDVAFTGFRLVREHPKAMLVWAGLHLAASLLMNLLMVLSAGPALTQLSRLPLADRANPAVTGQLVGQLGPFYLSMLVYSLGFYAIVWSTLNRVVLRPAQSGFGYVRLGPDELRQLLVALLLTALIIAAYVVGLLAVLLVGGLGAMLGAIGAGMAAIVGVLGLFAALAYLACRLSLVSPLAFDTGRIQLKTAWAMTRGRGFSILGAYALAWAFALLVLLLAFVIQAAIGAVIAGGVEALSASLLQPDMSSVAAAFSPMRLVMLSLSAIVMTALIPVISAPGPAIYRALVADAAPQDAF